jgi:hypothetical protein
MNLDPTTLITSGAIVIFLVQQLRRWLPTDFLPLAALVIGIGVQVVNDLALGGRADGATIWTSIVVGAGIGMAAAGAYDLAGRASTTIPPATITVDDTWLVDPDDPDATEDDIQAVIDGPEEDRDPDGRPVQLDTTAPDGYETAEVSAAKTLVGDILGTDFGGYNNGDLDTLVAADRIINRLVAAGWRPTIADPYFASEALLREIDRQRE